MSFTNGQRVRVKDDSYVTPELKNKIFTVHSTAFFGTFVTQPDKVGTVLITTDSLELVKEPAFAKGEYVRIEAGEALGYGILAGQDLQVTGLTANNDCNTHVTHGGLNYNLPTRILEKVPAPETRVEGDTILPEHVKVGDEILVRRHNGIMVIMKQGIVFTNEVRYDYDQKNRVIRVGDAVRSERIWSGKDAGTDKITLIKAVKEDEILKALKALPAGTHFKHGFCYAHKQMSGKWKLIYPTEIRTIEAKDIRATLAIGSMDEIKILKESK